MKNYHYLLLLIISLASMQLACQEPTIIKLDDTYLLGNTRSKIFKGNISSYHTERILAESYPEDIDSIKLHQIIGKKLEALSLKDLTNKKIIFSKEGKILFDPGYYNEHYKYNSSGLLSEVSTRGHESNRLYYREYFQYNSDTTECIARKYKMKKVKPQTYEGYDQYDSFEIADSIYWAGPDTIRYLDSETNYRSTIEGVKIEKITYNEGDTTISEMIFSRMNNEKTSKIEFVYYGNNRPAPFVRKYYYEKGILLKMEFYSIKNVVSFKEFPNLIKNTPDLYKFLEENLGERTSYFKYNSNGGGTETSDSFGKRSHEHQYIYDTYGNWIAQIYLNPETKKYGNVLLRIIEYY